LKHLSKGYSVDRLSLDKVAVDSTTNFSRC